MADVLFSLRTTDGSFGGGGVCGLDESDIIRILWENQNLFGNSGRVGIRSLDVQRCKGLKMSEQGFLTFCGQHVEPSTRPKRTPTCDVCQSGKVLIREPDGNGKWSERAGEKLMIGQSGFLLWFFDAENENLSAVLEPGALFDVLRKLGDLKAGAREAYDDAEAFSRLMSVLVKSAAGIEYDSKSMCSEEDQSYWLRQYMNTNGSTAKPRVSIRAYHTQACWAEEDEKTEQVLMENWYNVVNPSLQLPSVEAERLEASLDADPFLDSEQVFKTGCGSNFSPVMTTSLGLQPPVHPVVVPSARPTAQGVSAVGSQSEGEVSSWTSRAAAGADASPSANAPFHRWCASVGLGGRSNGLHADTAGFHFLGFDAEALKQMVPIALEERGIDRSQAVMVYKLMRATSGDGDATSATHSLCRQLADLGADKKIAKFMELLGKDLGSLKTMHVDDVRFLHLTADQRQIIAPLLAVKPSPDRDREEPRAQGARHPTRSSGRRDAVDDRHVISLPTKGPILSTERQQGRSLLAQHVHEVETPTSRVCIPPAITESKRDTIEGDMVRSAHPAELVDCGSNPTV
jgi:hypothetical protein